MLHTNSIFTVVSFLQLLFDLLNNFASGSILEPYHLSSLEGLDLKQLWSERGQLQNLFLESTSGHILALMVSAIGDVL